jgi:hypothetical protein
MKHALKQETLVVPVCATKATDLLKQRLQYLHLNYKKLAGEQAHHTDELTQVLIPSIARYCNSWIPLGVTDDNIFRGLVRILEGYYQLLEKKYCKPRWQFWRRGKTPAEYIDFLNVTLHSGNHYARLLGLLLQEIYLNKNQHFPEIPLNEQQCRAVEGLYSY